MINDNSEEEDYKDDAPQDLATADHGITYDVQLDQQGMTVAEALISKWGEIKYEDTPEYTKSMMQKHTDAEQFYDDIPVDYLEPVQTTTAYTGWIWIADKKHKTQSIGKSAIIKHRV